MTKRRPRNRFLQACLILLLTTYPALLRAQSLSVRLDKDQLKISAPQLRFLTGEAMQRLHDGASVVFVLEAAITSARFGSPLARTKSRFVFSYDIWEEKFAVTRVDAPSRSVSHLSASAAEAWCLDSFVLSAAGLSPNDPFWVLLEYRAEEPIPSSDGSDNSGFTLGGLIDIFSRRNQRQQLRGSREGGPFRLADLRNASPARSPGTR